MCWYNEEGTIFKHLIAAEDILVYKVIMSGLYSQCRKFKYERNKLYKQDIPLRVEQKGCRFIINRGYHSYSSLNTACVECYTYSLLNLSSDIIRQNHHMFIYDCIIPKGSVYYYNSDNHTIVSDQIIIKEKHKFN